MKHLSTFRNWFTLGLLAAFCLVAGSGDAALQGDNSGKQVLTKREALAKKMAKQRISQNGLETKAMAIATVDEVLTAIGLDPADAISPMIDADGQQYGVFAGLGTVAPTQGGNFAVFSSGVAGAATPYSQGPATNTEPGTDVGRGCPSDPAGFDCAILSFSFIVPAGINSIKFDFNFLSAEFPEFVGTIYNDTFTVQMTSPSYTGNIVFDANNALVSVNSALFNMSEAQLSGTGFGPSDPGDAGATGLLTTQAPVTPGETVTLEFRIRDEGDHIYDSAVFLDNFQYSTEEIDDPTTQGQVQVLWATPKSGPIEGGTQVTIHGMNFANVAEVRFGADVAQFAPINTETVVAVAPPAAAAGAVDLVVTAGVGSNLSTDTYEAGYIYYDDSPGATLELLSLDPAKGPTIGNVHVNAFGSGLNADTIVTFDGVEAPSTYFVHGGHLVVEPPPHDEGKVEVRVTNIDGSSAALNDGYLYLDDPLAGDGKGCNCSMVSKPSNNVPLGAASLALFALGVVLVRRRKKVMQVLLGSSAVLMLIFATGCNDTELAETNRPPLANAGINQEALVGTTNAIDGSNTVDPDGDDIVAYEWFVHSAPAESVDATFDDPTAEVTGFIPDVPGLYKIGLYATDSRGSRSRDIGFGGYDDDEVVDIIALPFHDFEATLEWDTQPSDLDLHFIRPGGSYWNQTDDCWYGQPAPEWGQSGIHSDDPSLLLDIDTGFGPEIISLKSAGEQGTYLLLVHAFNMHGGGPTYPRVTVGMNGSLAGEYIATQSMSVTDDVWIVAEVDYPTGALTEVNQFTTHQALGGPIH